MKRFLATLSLILALAIGSTAQVSSHTAFRIRFGAALPATCSPNTGDVFFKTAAPIGAYQCLVANTWTALAGASFPDLTDSAGVSLTSTVPLIVPASTSNGSTLSIQLAGATSEGLYIHSTGGAAIVGGTNATGWLAIGGSTSAGVQVGAQNSYGISSSLSLAAAASDIGFGRFAVGVMVVNNGTSRGDQVTPATVKSIWGKLGVGGGTTPVALTAQTAAITTTAILTGTANTAGTYRVCFNADTTTAGTGTTATVSILWNDGTARTFTSATFSLAATDITGQVNGCQVVKLAASQNISYSTAGTFGTSQYSLNASVEQLQ